MSQRIDKEDQQGQPPNDPPHQQPPEDHSEHTLSNQLRQLGEEEIKSALITENPQKTLENASRVDKDSANNTMLANSELIQLPVQQYMQQQQYVQQQTPLRLSTPVPTNRPPNFIQIGNTGNIQQMQVVPAPIYNQGLRSSLPATGPNQVINQGLVQNFSGWISQPATTQARIQTNVREFPSSQVQQIQGQARIPVYIQQNPNQIRPTSSSPQNVAFHYQPGQINIPNPPPQQPQMPPQPQPQQQPPKIVPHQPPQPVIVHPQPSIFQPPQTIVMQPIQPNQPYPPAPIRQIDHSNSAVFILPQPNQQAVLWQQRYFIILQKFQYYYTRIEIIHKKCIYLDQAIIQTKKPEQLPLLKAESQDLLNLITSTEQELTETIHRNRELLTEATNWKQKYQELAKAFEALKQSQAATSQELTHQVEILSRQLNELEANYNQITKQNKEEVAKNHKLEGEVQVLNHQLKQLKEKPSVPANYQEFQVQCKEMTKIIEQKNVIILNLKRALEEKDRSNNTTTIISPTAADVLQREIKRLEEVVTLKNGVIDGLQRQYSEFQTVHNSEINEYQQDIKKYKLQIADQGLALALNQESIKKLNLIIDSKTTEINNFSKQSGSSQGTPRNSETEIQNRRLKHQLTVYEESHASDLKILNGKLQELLDKVKMISNERDSTVGNLQEKATILQSDLNRKDGTIRNLRDRILELEEEKRIRDLDRKYQPKKTEDYSQGQEINSLRRELSDKVNEIDELEAQLTEYKRITNEYEDSLRVKKHEINTLKREMEERSEGVHSSSQLNEQLVKKNAELADLRNKLVELEKISNQNEILRQENNNLNESLRKKHSELSEAADKSYFLEKKVRELEASSVKSPKLIQLSQEIELLESVNTKKDQEIAKLRQSTQLLQSNVDELEIQLQRVKNRLNAGEKNLENQRGELKGKLSVLDLKVIEYERKIAGLEEVRTIMAEQVNTLTTEIQIKYQNQQRVELQLKQQRAKIKALQAEIQSQIIETESVRNKIRQWEKKYQSISKELEAESEKKKDLSNTKKNEFYNLNNKYMELQSSVKAKDNKIKELEKTVDSLNNKIRSFDHNIEEMEYLKHKISEYEHKISYQNHRFTTRLPDLEPTQVFERKVIYQLKVENEALRRQLGLAPKQEGIEVNIPEKDTNNNHVHQRLTDFHKKLEEVISENLVVDFNLTGDELYRRMERDRRLLIEKHNEEITQLKVKILEFQGRSENLPKRYTNINQIFNEQLDFYRQKNLQLEQRVESHIKVNRELKESIEILLKTQSGEASITYYKEQHEKANDTIVNLQRQLKKLNEELRKLKEDVSRIPSKQLIESNVVESETKTAEFNRKISQLTLQINLLQKDKVSKDQIINRNEVELKRLKVLIEQLKSAKEELQRNLKEKEHAYQDEFTKVTNKLRVNQLEIERLNGIVNSKQDQNSSDVRNLKNRIAELQEQNKKLKTKVEELIISEEKYQREIAKHENKIQVLMGQIQRLKEIADGVGKKHRQGDIELQSLRVTINQYESKIKTFESLRESFAYKETQLQQEIGRLVNQNKLLQTEIERMSEFTQKKVSQRDVEITRLKVLLNQKQDHSSRLQDQIRQMKVLSFKPNETAQEIFALKEEINNLKVIQGLKITESENRLKEIHELNDKLIFTEEQFLQAKRFYEAKINELQGIIGNLQNQLNETRKIRDNSSLETNSRVQSLQEQLRVIKSQKQQEIIVLKSRISVLEGQAQDLRSSYERQLSELRSANFNLQEKVSELAYLNNSLNEQFTKISSEYSQITIEIRSREDIISQLRLQISHLQQQLAAQHSSRSQTGRSSSEIQSASRYTVEYLRSILVEIDVLVGEEGSVRYDIQQRVEKQLEEGLEECKRWNEQLVL